MRISKRECKLLANDSHASGSLRGTVGKLEFAAEFPLLDADDERGVAGGDIGRRVKDEELGRDLGHRIGPVSGKELEIGHGREAVDGGFTRHDGDSC